MNYYKTTVVSFLLLGVFASLFSCVVSLKGKKGKIGSDGASSPFTALQSITESSVKQSLYYLASDELKGRDTGSKGIEKAAIYIENYFKNNRIQPFYENSYRDSFLADSIPAFNVIAKVEGNDPKLKNEIVVLGAHYDHIGIINPISKDSIANGANDDASGTVAVMEWAKYFSKTKTNKRTVIFALFSAEERGLKGSYYFAKKLKELQVNIYTMLNIEMIGVSRGKNHAPAFITGHNRSNLAERLNAYATKDVVEFYPKEEELQLFFRSDNYPFYKEFQIPAHAMSTTDLLNFRQYHQVGDEAALMDLSHMTQFIRQMIPSLTGIINTPTQEIKLNDKP